MQKLSKRNGQAAHAAANTLFSYLIDDDCKTHIW